MQLLIVESPTKARTFGRLIPNGSFEIMSSMGHVRDLPERTLGVDVENNFEPTYAILSKKKKLVSELLREAKKAESVILATDPDREGEAIAYHLETIIHDKLPKKPITRIVFHEITKQALEHALSESREVNTDLFYAQQARRILDRLVGYKVSPYLWKRFSKHWLSAGRVQTVALRFVVEREKERRAFASEPYFSFTGEFKIKGAVVTCELETLKGKQFFTTHKHTLFDGTYSVRVSSITSEKNAQEEHGRLQKEQYTVSEVRDEESLRSPQPPFITSTLQQHASTQFGYSAKRTMSIAQKLYENGLISYHRTDSFNLSQEFIARARKQLQETYGDSYLSSTVRVFRNKNKLAQEAHEAIRPTDVHTTELTSMGADAAKLYRAIYARAMATQMKEAKIRKQTVTIESKVHDQFIAQREQVLFPGFLRIYGESKQLDTIETSQGMEAHVNSITANQKQTAPPARYTEASLIKTLEKRGIGRPSTYAPIVSLIQERQYVRKEERALAPTELGEKIVEVLQDSFSHTFDVDFTARMEEELDQVAIREKKWKDMIKAFYTTLAAQLESAYTNTEKVRVEEKTDETCPECGEPLVIKMSRFGKFYACSRFPDCKYTKPYLQKTGVICPECGKGELVVRFSKKRRRFYACSEYPACKYTTLWLKSEAKKQDEGSDNQQENSRIK